MLREAYLRAENIGEMNWLPHSGSRSWHYIVADILMIHTYKTNISELQYEFPLILAPWFNKFYKK